MKKQAKNWLRFAGGLYAFILAVHGFEFSWHTEFLDENAFDYLKRSLSEDKLPPFALLFVGIVLTSMIQSSSASIILMISAAAAHLIGFQQAVYYVLGANIGTSFVNAIVSLTYSRRHEEFDRTIPAAMIDDIFKIMNVTLFAVLEASFRVLSKLSDVVLRIFPNIGDGSLHWPRTVDFLVGGPLRLAQKGIMAVIESPALAGIVLFILSLVVLRFAIKWMSGALRKLLEEGLAGRIKSLAEGRIRNFLSGFAICWLLQSSSVSISLAIPLIAHNLLSLKQVYYYSLGAALATTCDPAQLIAYATFGREGLHVGIVHIFLNLMGVAIFGLIPVVREAAPEAAKRLGGFISRSGARVRWLLAYVIVLFFVIPLTAIWISR